MHGYAVTERPGKHPVYLHRVTLAGIAATAQHTEIGTVMCPTLGQRDDVVHSQVSRVVCRDSPPWAVITVASPVCTEYLLSYCSVLAGVSPGVCTTTLPITLRLVLSSTAITARGISGQTHTVQAGPSRHGYTHAAGRTSTGAGSGTAPGSGVQSQLGRTPDSGPEHWAPWTRPARSREIACEPHAYTGASAESSGPPCASGIAASSSAVARRFHITRAVLPHASQEVTFRPQSVGPNHPAQRRPEFAREIAQSQRADNRYRQAGNRSCVQSWTRSPQNPCSPADEQRQ